MKKNIHKIFLKEVASTNNYASHLLNTQKLREETIVIATTQTNGRGQAGNLWESESGKNLTLSFILFPKFLQAKWQFMLTKVFSLALINLLKELKINAVSIKWPNDIYVSNNKIAGILIENFIAGSVISSTIAGIGLNINQQKFSNFEVSPTSLKLITNEEFDTKEILELLLNHLEYRYIQLKNKEWGKLNTDYYSHLLGMESTRKYIYKEELILATIKGVTDFGELILEWKNKKITCGIKEIGFVF